MPEVWTPGMQLAPVDELVDRLHRQIREFGEGVVVEVELHDGVRYRLESIAAEPGFGLVTLRPHPGPGEETSAVIVPLGSIVRITLRAHGEEQHEFGFSLPAA